MSIRKELKYHVGKSAVKKTRDWTKRNMAKLRVIFTSFPYGQIKQRSGRGACDIYK